MNEKIDKLLKDALKFYDNTERKTPDNLYYFLTTYNIPNEDRDFKVKPLFNEWIDYFKDNPNIKVFNSPSLKYFCQFVNYPNDQQPLSNPIKMYLHIGSKDILEVGKLIFDFLAQNNIIHNSKIGSDIRLDDIVIRVYSKDDYYKIKDFIQKTPRIKNALQETIPIAFHDENINLAIDRDLSYNQAIAAYIYWYIVDSKKEKKEICYKNFLSYISNIYLKVFIKKNKEDIDLFIKRFDRHYIKIPEDLLNNYHEVTKTILESLIENNMTNYFQVLDFCNNEEMVENRILDYNYAINKNNNVLESDILLLKECILVMYKLYGIEDTIQNIDIFVKTGNLKRITRENNLRTRFVRSMSPSKIKNILGDKTIEMLVTETIEPDSYFKEINPKEILDKAILETYKKYGIEQVVQAIKVATYGNYNYFTNTDNAREILKTKVTKDQIKSLVNEDILFYVVNTLQDSGIELSIKNR